MDYLTAIERRRRNLRIALFIIILATLPFYCAGILLWGSAPQRAENSRTTLTPTHTFTPGATNTPVLFPSITPLNFATSTFQSPLQPTPIQFFPPTRFLSPTPPFAFPTATDFIFPTSTLAPSLTPYPTDTPPPTAAPLPTDTPLPFPTDPPPQPTIEAPTLTPTVTVDPGALPDGGEVLPPGT